MTAGSTRYRMDSEEEALFRSYPYALYFVQSPSTFSHHTTTELPNTTTTNESSTFHSPLRHQEPTQFSDLSRYSSRGSNNNSFLHEKKIAYDVDDSHGNGTDYEINGENHHVFVKDEVGDFDHEDDENDEYDWFGRKNGGWFRYFSFGYSSSFFWMLLQIGWRFLVSFAAALLVFYLATKPPPPMMSIKMAGIRQFGLGEGVDMSGVTTKILTCNCSMELVIENKSKVFGLHIHPSVITLSFGNLPLASSHGPELYEGSDTSTVFQLYVGTKNKPMYGAGRSMQDLLESGKGLPLIIHTSLKSSFHVVWKIIKPKFYHKVECLLILTNTYDKKHHTQAFNSSCVISTA